MWHTSIFNMPWEWTVEQIRDLVKAKLDKRPCWLQIKVALVLFAKKTSLRLLLLGPERHSRWFWRRERTRWSSLSHLLIYSENSKPASDRVINWISAVYIAFIAVCTQADTFSYISWWPCNSASKASMQWETTWVAISGVGLAHSLPLLYHSVQSAKGLDWVFLVWVSF